MMDLLPQLPSNLRSCLTTHTRQWVHQLKATFAGLLSWIRWEVINFQHDWHTQDNGTHKPFLSTKKCIKTLGCYQQNTELICQFITKNVYLKKWLVNFLSIPKNNIKNKKNDWFILTFGISFPRFLSYFILRNWVFDVKFKNWKIIILTFRLLLIRLSQ